MHRAARTGEHGSMARPSNWFVRFQKHPSSVRYATAAIISTIAALVVVGALLIRLLAPGEFASFGDAVWFTLQTVTTVGYGDETPTSVVGRLVASVVMLVSIGLITVITAAITSMFIRAVGREQKHIDQQAVAESLARIEAALASAHERIDQLDESTRTARTDD